MKTLKFSPFLLLTLMIAAISTNSCGQKSKKFQEVKIKTSAVCSMCKDRIEKAMAYEKGVKSAGLDIDTKILTVVYNSKKTNPDKLRDAVTRIGYDADEKTADPKAYEKLPACCKKQ